MLAPKIGEYCGNSIPPRHVSATNEVFLHFKSDCCGINTGFKLEYNSYNKLY